MKLDNPLCKVLCDCPRGLASSVPDGEELILVIDQFEELFTLVEDESVRRRFLDSMVEAARGDRVRFVLTLRADHYDGPLAYVEFAEIFTAGVIHVMPLSVTELEEAAVQPATTDALYFVARGDGTHEFSATLKQHNRAVARYQLKGGTGKSRQTRCYSEVPRSSWTNLLRCGPQRRRGSYFARRQSKDLCK